MAQDRGARWHASVDLQADNEVVLAAIRQGDGARRCGHRRAAESQTYYR